MQRFLPLATLLLVAVFAGSACAAARVPPATASVTLRGQRFTVEMATTPTEQAHGLMQRTSMPVDHGMLFVFADSAPRVFWMKNTLIPLDMLFFDAQRHLVAIQADAQPCAAEPCALYPSGVPARYVLELNAGTAARLGMRNGDAITFSAAISEGQ